MSLVGIILSDKGFITVVRSKGSEDAKHAIERVQADHPGEFFAFTDEPKLRGFIASKTGEKGAQKK